MSNLPFAISTMGAHVSLGSVSPTAPVVIPAAPLLFDTYTNMIGGAFLFKVKSTQAKGWRVRRSSDNAEQDVGFASNGWMDTAAVLSFAGAGDAFITIWYDPWNRGSAYDIKCTVAGNQAYIVKAGVLKTENGRPIAGADGRDVYYSAPAIDTRQTNYMNMGWVGAGAVAGGRIQIPVAHRSDLGYGNGRLFAKLEATTTPTVSNVMSFQRAQDAGDAMTTHSTGNLASNLDFACWTCEHSWTGGGALYKNGVNVVGSGGVGYFTDVDQGGRNTVAGYYPFMGDGQSGTLSWRGTFGGGFYGIASINLATAQAAMMAAYGY